MYGKRRVVLSSQSNRWGNRLVAICGSDGHGGNYHPLGCWYANDGLYYADLQSKEQWYSSVSRDDLANKQLGGLPTKAALREFVMEYYRRQQEGKS